MKFQIHPFEYFKTGQWIIGQTAVQYTVYGCIALRRTVLTSSTLQYLQGVSK